MHAWAKILNGWHYNRAIPLSAPQTISAQWKDLEGQSLGSCTLQTFIGGSDQTAVFATTRSNGEKAAIKLAPLDPRTSELKLSRLRQAMRLSHPHLLRIYDAGIGELQGKSLLWVLTSFADEDLSQVLPVRALTPTETGQMLSPVLAAISYLHREGFIHGRIKPSNIMAIGDQVKLSTDSLSVQGDPPLNTLRTAYDAPELKQGKSLPASDMWSLGMSVVNVLTQSVPSLAGGAAKIPDSIPKPFSTIAERCLQVDARQRASLDEIQDLLKRPTQPVVAASAVREPSSVRERTAPRETPVARTAIQGAADEPHKRGINLAYVLPVVALLLILIGLWWNHNSNHPSTANRNSANPSSANQGSGNQAQSRASSPASPIQPPAASAKHTVNPPPQAEPEAARTAEPDGSNVVRQVLPQISAGARSTVTGRVRVSIRARVDAEGNVMRTSFDSHGPSEYFARKAMEASQEWKFARSAGETLWVIRFGFGRKDTLASATRLSR
ncbi:MAG: hypothetical protein DMG91_14980 [Acidobacteria bacterium]|nr:MAG: hypothetical protein DMG91_14980 [Acidobacteriota bacterium]